MNITKFFVTLGGAGLVPRVSGTAGTLVATLLAIPLLGLSLPYLSLIWGAVFLCSWHTVDKYVKDTANPDPKEVVIDELLGIWFVLFFTFHIFRALYEFTFAKFAVYLLVCFGLFRLFDILKPFPIGYIERKTKKYPISVILDDVIAAVAVLLIMFGYWMYFVVK